MRRLARSRSAEGGRTGRANALGSLRERRAVPYMAGAAVLVALALALSIPSDPPKDVVEDGPSDGRIIHSVGIPLQNISREASFYTYDSGSSEVRFFVIWGADSQLHVGLDACDTCYRAKMGFHQEVDEMVCNSCAKRFPISGIGSSNVPGGCWPYFVEYEVNEDFVLVGLDQLDGRAWMFR